MKEGKELKAPRHASAAAARDDTWQLFALFPTLATLLYSCHLHTDTAWLAEQISILLIYYCHCNISLAIPKLASKHIVLSCGGRQGASGKRANSDFPSQGWKILIGWLKLGSIKYHRWRAPSIVTKSHSYSLLTQPLTYIYRGLSAILLVTQGNSPITTSRVGTVMMVDRLDWFDNEEGRGA